MRRFNGLYQERLHCRFHFCGAINGVVPLATAASNSVPPLESRVLSPLYEALPWSCPALEKPPPPSTATMTGHWPFRKTDVSASSILATKKKVSPPKKERNQPYFSVEIVQALYNQNASVDLRDVHLPDG
jgi:hypothetical protein